MFTRLLFKRSQAPFCRSPSKFLSKISRNSISTGIKMELGDKAVGALLTTISLAIFTYYTFWVVILPFVESDHFIHQYFLPSEFAVLIPVFAGVALLCFLSVFVGLVMVKSKKKKT